MQRFQNDRKNNAGLDVSVCSVDLKHKNHGMVEYRDSAFNTLQATISPRFDRSNKAKERKGSNSTKHARVKRNKRGETHTCNTIENTPPTDLRFGAMGDSTATTVVYGLSLEIVLFNGWSVSRKRYVQQETMEIVKDTGKKGAPIKVKEIPSYG